MTEIKTDEAEQVLKQYGFTTRDRQKNLKPLYYKGIHSKNQALECKLVGTIKTNNYETFVIQVEKNLYNISPAYLKEMQSSNFTQNSAKEVIK